MPIGYLRRLTSSRRSARSNRHLARYLAFIAGAVNAGGFVAIHQYTSHMTGIVSTMADDLAAGQFWPALTGGAAILSFFAGSVCTTLLIRWGKRWRLHSQYSLPLLLEALLFGIFSAMASLFPQENVVAIIALLCFGMGLQNAMITKLSNAVIRTTHLTGMITDIGICCGRLLTPGMTASAVDREDELGHLTLLASLVFLFFAGGLTGAVGFQRAGFLFMAPLALCLIALAAVPLIDDVSGIRKRRLQSA